MDWYYIYYTENGHAQTDSYGQGYYDWAVSRYNYILNHIDPKARFVETFPWVQGD